MQDVAALCQVSADSVRRAIQRGELEVEEVFGCLRVRRGALKDVPARAPAGGRSARAQAQPRRASCAGIEGGSLRALMRGGRRRAA